MVFVQTSIWTASAHFKSGVRNILARSAEPDLQLAQHSDYAFELDKERGMNTLNKGRFGLSLLCVALFVGCGGDNDIATLAISSASRSVILGTWDASLVIDEAKAKEIDTVALEVARSAEFQFEYRDDGTMRLSVRTNMPDVGPHSSEVEGTWKLIREDDESIQLTVHYDDISEGERVRLVIIDEDTIETHAPEDLNGLGILRLTRLGR